MPHLGLLQNICSYFSPLLAVWKVTMSWEATGTEALPRIRMLWSLKAERKQRWLAKHFWWEVSTGFGVTITTATEFRQRTNQKKKKKKPENHSLRSHRACDLCLDCSCSSLLDHMEFPSLVTVTWKTHPMGCDQHSGSLVPIFGKSTVNFLITVPTPPILLFYERWRVHSTEANWLQKC